MDTANDIQKKSTTVIEPLPGIFAPVTATSALRLVTGRVNRDGTIAAGSGFTVNRSATGTYTVTFTAGFKAIPLVIVTNDDSTKVSFVRASGETVTTFVVETYNASVVKDDTAFAFLATDIK